MKRARNVDWFGRMAFYGVMGLLCCWVPVLAAAVMYSRRRFNGLGAASFRDLLAWEWATYVRIIEESVE